MENIPFDREPNFQILLKSIKFLERRIFGQRYGGDVKSIHEPEPTFGILFTRFLEALFNVPWLLPSPECPGTIMQK